jgi:selenium metabolism protein YedF
MDKKLVGNGDGDHIIVFKNDKMGFGDDELGTLLIKGFIAKIGEVTPLPKKMIFYNCGAKLVQNDSPVMDSLRELEHLGVSILVCGTCVDYFGIGDLIGCGTVSNMHEITDSMTKASKILSP